MRSQQEYVFPEGTESLTAMPKQMRSLLLLRKSRGRPAKAQTPVQISSILRPTFYCLSHINILGIWMCFTSKL